MNLIITPNVPIDCHPQGRISITIGKIAVESKCNKAQPCHSGSTEVTRHGPLVPRSERPLRPIFSRASFEKSMPASLSGWESVPTLSELPYLPLLRLAPG